MRQWRLRKLLKLNITGGDKMAEMDKNQNEDGTYEKPVLRRFPLRAEEAVLGFCKNPSAGGVNIGNCAIPAACSSLGS